ncbi:PA0069 family radical SAM protein [Dokdonia sp. Hel_I_53]|uniref:PA0069 family radical SAM protein n=1 Tax=Dokdonia sp. Hel_I_53 TaxID=1566287 RepID=UPI00119C0E36|nr:PA0069 family radical SAM protein [Dokdonia sp. Hel_I_53]TVZ52541.1 DNA repair photolyase [Dokdonia sp. Hel_I_53]
MKECFTGRGAQQKVENKFFDLSHEFRDDYKEHLHREGLSEQPKTDFIATFPKTIVTKVQSPDVHMSYSLNPYQGCEHGCIYCYARNSHQYWGYGPGIDFEQKILVKQNCIQLLEEFFQKKSWNPAPIVLSGNTDCYQPIEKKLQLTRSLLEVFFKYKNPVGIITKNALVQRDIDILTALAQDQLAMVWISITTLSEETRRILEPRTATIKKRLETIEKLTQAGIPVGVMVAPVIPGLTSHEILPIVKEVSDRGALKIGHTIVRLNGAIGSIFEDWAYKKMPNKAAKILHQIAAFHGGQLNDSSFQTRMRGSGPVASQINRQFEIAKKKYMSDRELPELSTKNFVRTDRGQLGLF